MLPSGSRRCYPAPFAPEALRADLVLCTHGHADHMAKDTLRGLARHPAARFVLPAGCSALAAEYGIPADRITTVQEGSILPLGGVTVRAFSAAHPEHILDAGDSGMALGYQLTFGGFTVVHLGDTYLTPHLYETLQALPRPDLLLAPINGQDFFRTQRNCIGNLEAEEAAQLAVRLGQVLVGGRADGPVAQLHGAKPPRLPQKSFHGVCLLCSLLRALRGRLCAENCITARPHGQEILLTASGFSSILEET